MSALFEVIKRLEMEDRKQREAGLPLNKEIGQFPEQQVNSSRY
ncbi:MAG: hypothetical protein ACFFDI_00275 [Promethearchaeota archaeon]